MSPFHESPLYMPPPPLGKKVYIGAILGALALHACFFALLGSGLLGSDGRSAADTAGEDDDAKGLKSIEVTLNPFSENPSPELLFLSVAEGFDFREDTSSEAFLVEENVYFFQDNGLAATIVQPDIPVLDVDLSQLPTDLSAKLNPDFMVLKTTPQSPPKTKTAQTRSGRPSSANSPSDVSGGGNGGAGNSNAAVIAPRYKSAPKPPYPPSARQSGHEGTVRLKISLDSSGNPVQVQVVSSSGYSELDQSAVGFVKSNWKFHPAQKEGNNVAWTIITSVIFSLKSNN